MPLAFRFRPRTKQPPRLPLSSDEDDSDLSSPEHLVDPRKFIRGHATTAVDIVNLPKPTDSTAASPSSDTHTSTHANAACDITRPIVHQKPTLLRRVTSKLHIAIPSKSPHLTVAASSPSPSPCSPQSPPALARKQTRSPNQPRRRNSFLPPQPPALPNSFVTREHRQAALRERGLLPPRKDLSQQEREEDARLPVVALASAGVAKSLAEKIREEWIATNKAEDDPVLPAYSLDDAHASIQQTPVPTPPASTADATNDAVQSHQTPPSGQDQEQTIAPPQQTAVSVPRASCSSLPRLSTSLEVLQEEEDPEGPFTPLPSVPPPDVHVADAESRRPGIVISTAVDAYRQGEQDSPIKAMVEGLFDAACLSPLSCHGSGLLSVPSDPSSPCSLTLQTCSQDLPRPSVASLPPRRHTTDTCNRPPPSTIASRYQSSLSLTASSVSRTTSSLSRRRSALGKVSSFADLRRTVSTSFRSVSNVSYRSATPSRLSTETGTPRTPVSPTMHNRASLLNEMRAIEDPESRRLCEMAFLD